MDADREYDVVVLGATGFAGRLVAEDLTRELAVEPHHDQARSGARTLRWAIAGRNLDKLAATRDRLAAIDQGGMPHGIEQADVADADSLASLASRARVLATTVGPYVLHGEQVVEACIRSGTDCVDITGEPAFVRRLLERHDQEARERGVRIVNCCGFDSIPPDLGVQHAVEHLPEGVPLRLRGFLSVKGRPSGGTFVSALDIMARGASLPRPRPPQGRAVGSLPRRIERVEAIGGWAVPLPTIDPQIVLRSAAALDRYGPDFRYGHYAKVRSRPVAFGVAAGAGALAALAKVPPARALLRWVGPDPGTGPDEQRRARSWFRLVVLGEGGGRHVRTEVRGGDPGYTETARMLTEAARCLVEDRSRLPEVAGVLTPAVAFGAVLRERLRKRGIAFDVVETG